MTATRIATGDNAQHHQVTITWNDQPIAAVEGEPLIVALLANGIDQFRSMPLTGEPRGGYCMIGRCTDCQVIVDGIPGVRACQTTVKEGMTARFQQGLGEWNDEFALPD